MPGLQCSLTIIFTNSQQIMTHSRTVLSFLLCAALQTPLLTSAASAADSLRPWTAAEVPRTATDVWKDYDPRAEPLDVRVIREWQTDDIVTRYITFRVGEFRGAESRIAAWYSFPRNGQRNAAFVWSHGGGQRAEKSRGIYFATQGYATIDINWLGRSMDPEIEENTNWGNVDPTQGPRFYPHALREHWKQNLQPDEYTIDAVVSPRNSNWFLLALAARRAITFLEQQPEVDAARIGFSGFSMGGMITALTAIDSRLKAVAPFVGGSGFKHIDFPGGIEGSSIGPHFRDPELYACTMDPAAYWPHVTCPVMFISSSNDFHSTFERINRSMQLVPHRNWRVSTNIHMNHGPGPEQWALLNLWFDEYLRGIPRNIPVTPPSTLTLDGTEAVFSVTPADSERLVATEIYYSYDPNSRTRFWIRADAQQQGNTSTVRLPTFSQLPLYVFAMCRYRLPQAVTLERGATDTVIINSAEQMLVPDDVDLKQLRQLEQNELPLEDFSRGLANWSSRDQFSIQTYRFQDPRLNRSENRRLQITVNPLQGQYALRLNVESSFLSRERNLGKFTCVRTFSGDKPQTLILTTDDFQSDEQKQLRWDSIAVFELVLVDRSNNNARIPLTSAEGLAILKRIELID